MGTIVQIEVPSPAGAPARSKLPEDSPLQFLAADGTYFVSQEELPLLHAQGVTTHVLRTIPEEEIPVRFYRVRPGEVADPPAQGARLAVLARLLSEERATGDIHIRYLGRNRTIPPDGFVQDRAGGDRAYVWQVVPSEMPEEQHEQWDRFERIRESFADPDTRVVLSLGSGGVKLFAHATALRLLELLDCSQYVDEIWGSSAGAVVGLLYSHGLSPQAIEQSGYDLYSGRYNLTIRPTKFQFLRHLLRDTFLPSEDPDAAGFVDCAQGLSAMLDQYCASFEPRLPFYCIAFNLAECRTEALTPNHVPEHLRGLLSQTNAREAALASSTVPLLFIPRRIQRNGLAVPYVDGSTTEDVPLFSPARKFELDREAGVETRRRLLIFYVKLTSGPGPYRSYAGRMGKLRLLQTVASAAMHTMHQRDMMLLSARPEISLMGLQFMDSEPDFFETRRIPEFIRNAKDTFPEQLAQIEERLRRS